MSDYLSNLTAKSLNQVAVLQPRLASRFEPWSIAKQAVSEVPFTAMSEPLSPVVSELRRGVITSPVAQTELSPEPPIENHEFGDQNIIRKVVAAPIPEVPQQTRVPLQSSRRKNDLATIPSEATNDILSSIETRPAIAPKSIVSSRQNSETLLPKPSVERQTIEAFKAGDIEVRAKETPLDLFSPPGQPLMRSPQSPPATAPEQAISAPVGVEAVPANPAPTITRIVQPAPERAAPATEDRTTALPQMVMPPLRQPEPVWRGQLSPPAAEPQKPAVMVLDSAPAPVLHPRVVQPVISQRAIEPAPPAEFAVTEPPAVPTIQVTIGRIEVRATPPPSTPPSRQRSTPAVMGLDDYLRQRAKGANK